MRRLLPLSLAAFFLAVSVYAQDDAEKIRGTWTVVAAQKSGQKMPEEALKQMKVTIRADAIVIADGSRPGEEAVYKLDPSKKPKAIDITPSKNAKDKIALGVYELDGDTLKINWSKEGGARPTTLVESTEDRDRVILVLKREKKP